MKILLDARPVSDRLSGVGKYAFRLAAHLPTAFPNVQFVVAYNPRIPNQRFRWEDVPRTPNLRITHCAGTGFGVFDGLPLRALLRRERVDLLHAPLFTGAFASPVPSLVTVHDLILYEPGYPHRLRGAIGRWMMTRTVRAANCLVTMTGSVRSQVLQFFRPLRAPVVAIPWGVEIPPDTPLPAKWDPRRPYVLYVGVHRPHKNIDGLLAGMAQAFPRGEVALIVAGTFSELTPRLMEQARRLGIADSVQFTGHVSESELGGLIRHAHALALVSYHEGFGVPPLEALAVGVPVVVSDLGVFRETCGGAAHFVDPSSPESIAGGLKRAVEGGEDQALRAEEGRTRARALSWASLSLRFGECYGLPSENAGNP